MQRIARAAERDYSNYLWNTQRERTINADLATRRYARNILNSMGYTGRDVLGMSREEMDRVMNTQVSRNVYMGLRAAQGGGR